MDRGNVLLLWVLLLLFPPSLNNNQTNFDWSVEPNLRAFLSTVRSARNSDSTLVPELFDLLDKFARRTREGYNTFSTLSPDVKALKPLMPKGLFLFLCINQYSSFPFRSQISARFIRLKTFIPRKWLDRSHCSHRTSTRRFASPNSSSKRGPRKTKRRTPLMCCTSSTDSTRPPCGWPPCVFCQRLYLRGQAQSHTLSRWFILF